MSGNEGVEPDERDLRACTLLMRALQLVDPSVAQFWFDPVRKCLGQFNLPGLVCDVCKDTQMSFWDYHLAQGMCQTCIEKQAVLSPE